MGRYRTIKPEFWSDDNMLDLTDSCALFYVSIWNFCDDEGKIENKPRGISKLVCRWSEGKVKSFIKKLVTSGRLRVSICSTWLQVENWSHQKIDRPKQPKVRSNDLQWITENNSSSTRRSFDDHSTQGEEERVEESNVEEGRGMRARVDFIPSDENTPRETFTVTLPDKNEMFEEIFSDEKFMGELARSYPGQNLEKAWDECWRHHSVKPVPPEHGWQWRQKLSTWLSIESQKKNGSTKTAQRTEAVNARREAFAKRHSTKPGG